MDLRPTNGDEKLPVEPYDPWQSRDRKGADDSPNFRPFFKGVGPAPTAVCTIIRRVVEYLTRQTDLIGFGLFLPDRGRIFAERFHRMRQGVQREP